MCGLLIEIELEFATMLLEVGRDRIYGVYYVESQHTFYRRKDDAIEGLLLLFYKYHLSIN